MLALLALAAVPWGQGAVGHGVDLWGTLWIYEWTAESIATLSSPFHSDWAYWPEGEDLFREAGGNQVDAILAAPLVWLFEMPGWMAPWTAAMLLANALGMRAYVRGMGGSRPAGLVAAVAFAASPFIWTELSYGRPTQVLLVFLPLALLQLRKLEEAWWRAPLAGTLLAAQAWTYWFTGHLFLLVLVPALLVLGSRRPRAWWYRLGQAAGTCLLLVGPAVVWMFFGGEVVGADILSPEPMGWWVLKPSLGPMAVSVFWLAAFTAVGFSKERVAWGLALAVGLLLCAGPSLFFRGEVSLPNPVWLLADLLPGWERFHYPYRAFALVSMVTCIALSEAIDVLPARARWFSLAALPLLLSHVGPLPTTEIDEPVYAAALRADPGVVVDLPWKCSVGALHLQIFHRQPTLGAMTENLEGYAPEGHNARVDADPLLGPVTRLSRGGRVEALGEGGIPEVEWVILHRPLMLAEAMEARGCGTADRVAVERQLIAWFGEPVADDGAHAAFRIR